jgi:glycosyltransferase involved in cell wall biosynthesis
VATDADGLADILTDRRDALLVAKGDAAALTRAIDELIDQPTLAKRLAENARRTGEQYDIAVFVRKMERLYEILHQTSRATNRAGVLNADLGFLTTHA